MSLPPPFFDERTSFQQITLFLRSAFDIRHHSICLKWNASLSSKKIKKSEKFIHSGEALQIHHKGRDFDGSLCHGFLFFIHPTIPEKRKKEKNYVWKGHNQRWNLLFDIFFFVCTMKLESEWKGAKKKNYYMSKQKVSHFKYTLAILSAPKLNKRMKA